MRFGPPTGAQFQAYETRWRLAVQLVSRLIFVVLLGWIALTTWVVWHETAIAFPQLDHQYFKSWVLCSVLSPFNSRIKIPSAGVWYPLPQFADWLDSRQMYGASFGIWFKHYAWRTAAIPIGLGVIAIVWRVRHSTDGAHLRGLKLLTPKQHNAQLNGNWVAQMTKPQNGGIRLGSSVIPHQLETEHFLITGSPGSGKSTLIRHLLSQIDQRGEIAIVVDPEAEFSMEFYKPERGDVLLNPLDARCPFWSPWLEFRDESFDPDAEVLASSLIRGNARTATETFFQDSSRTLIEAAFQVVQDRSSCTSIADFFALPRGEMHEALVGTRAFALIDERSAETGTGIISGASNATKPFFNLPQRHQTNRTWSARDWATERPGWIFLPSTEDARAATRRMQGMWLDCLVRWLMTNEMGGDDRVWIVADELPVLEYQAELATLLTRGRKRGICVVIGFQNISQLRSIYGREGATTLTSCPTTQVILRITEAETAKWASQQLGEREVERLNVTQLAGVSTYREGINLGTQRVTEHLVLPAEIQLLKPFHGFLSVAGHDRCALTFPERHLVKHHPAFIPRHTAPPAADKGQDLYGAC